MKRGHLISSSTLLFFVTGFLAVWPSCAEVWGVGVPRGEPQLLNPGDSVSRTLNSAGKHLYTIRAEAGKCIRLSVDQRGIDLVISLLSSDGVTVKRTDRPSGSYGKETVTYVAPRDETLTVELTAFVPDSLDGGYEIAFVGSGGPSQDDRVRSKAEDLTSSAEELRGQASREKKIKALELFAEALALWESLGDRYEQSIVHYGIGFTNHSLSNHNAASISYHRALRLAREADWLFGQAVIHSAQGSVQYALSAHDLSIFNYTRAIAIYRKLNNSRGLGIAFHGLGTAQMLSERYREADSTLRESKVWRQRANDRGGLILTELTLANLSLLERKPEAAEAELKSVAEILGPEKASSNAQYLYYLGRTYVDLNRNTQALEVLLRASSIFEKEGNRLRQAQNEFEISRALFSLGRVDEALPKISGATAIVEELRKGILNLRLRIGFASFLEPFFEHHVRVLMELHERNPEKGFDRAAFDVSERARARGLLDGLERRSLIRRGLIDSALLEQEGAAKDGIEEFLARGSEVRSDEQTIEFEESLARYAELEGRIDSQLLVPESTSLSTVGADEARSLIAGGSALLSYTIANEKLYLWLVTEGGVKSFDLGESKTVKTMAVDAFKCFSKRPGNNSKDSCRRKSEALGRILLSSVSDQIEGKRLTVVRNGSLELVPWSALVDPRSGRYLVETNEVVSVPSASVLGMLKRIKQPSGTGAAIFADPVYSPSDTRLKGRKTEASPDMRSRLPRLFASRFEAARIASLYASEKVSAYVDFKANREGFKNADLRNFRLIHFATHAVIDDVNPERSAIVLSLFDEDGRAKDGMIRFNDIERLDLNAELVTLSACQTGLGKQVKGEGFASLAQSFFAAGARKVLFSGWQVDDKVTAETMSRFYTKLASEKVAPSAALRQSQLSIMRDPRWSHPYYWAAFSIQGEL